MPTLANLVKKEINAVIVAGARLPLSGPLVRQVMANQCQSLHVVVMIRPYPRNVGLPGKLPAAGKRRPTGNLESVGTIAMAARSGTTDVLATYQAFCLEPDNREVWRVGRWLSFDCPDQR
jgi:hypothetical protein